MSTTNWILVAIGTVLGALWQLSELAYRAAQKEIRLLNSKLDRKDHDVSNTATCLERLSVALSPTVTVEAPIAPLTPDQAELEVKWHPNRSTLLRVVNAIIVKDAYKGKACVRASEVRDIYIRLHPDCPCGSTDYHIVWGLREVLNEYYPYWFVYEDSSKDVYFVLSSKVPESKGPYWRLIGGPTDNDSTRGAGGS